MAGVRVEIDQAAIDKLRARSDVQALLADRAESIADAARSAGIMVESIPGDIPLPVEVHVENDGDTARASVVLAHPSGMAVEAKHRLLVGSIDAAR